MLTLEGVAERIFQQHDICGVKRMDMDMYRGGYHPVIIKKAIACPRGPDRDCPFVANDPRFS